MSNEQIALLRSLAQRPSDYVVPSAQAILSELVRAGYVAMGPFGWMATAAGCDAVERVRPMR